MPIVRYSYPPSDQKNPSQSKAGFSNVRGGKENEIADGSIDGQPKHEQIKQFLQELLRDNGGRVDLPMVGKEILEKFRRYPDGGSLKSMLAVYVGDDLQIAQDEQRRIYIYHPATYNSGARNSQDRSLRAGDLFPEQPEFATMVRRITSGTGAPDLTGEQYTAVFRSIAEEINANGYNFTDTSRHGRDRCHAIGYRVPRTDVTYVLRCLHHSGHNLHSQQEEVAIAQSFKSGLLGYCRRNQIELSDDELRLFDKWIENNSPNIDPTIG